MFPLAPTMHFISYGNIMFDLCAHFQEHNHSINQEVVIYVIWQKLIKRSVHVFKIVLFMLCIFNAGNVLNGIEIHCSYVITFGNVDLYIHSLIHLCGIVLN
jgi:hypothetical protein